MKLSKKRIESFLGYILKRYVRHLEVDSEEAANNCLAHLLTLLYAGNCLGIFNSSVKKIISSSDLGFLITCSRYGYKRKLDDIDELQVRFKDQLKKIMTAAAKKTMEDKDEKSSKHQDRS